MSPLHRVRHLVPLAALASLLIANLACSQAVGLLSPTRPPTPTIPEIMCTAPACGPDESYYCPGKCPGGCGTTCATNTPGPTPTSHCPPGAFFLPEGDTFKCMTPTAYVSVTPAGSPCAAGELYLPIEGVFQCVTPTPWIPTPWTPTAFDLTLETPAPLTPQPPTSTPEALAAAPCLIITRTPPPSAPTAMDNGTAVPGRRVDPHVELCASAATLRVGDSVTLVGQVVDIGLPYYYVMMRPAGAGDFQPWLAVTYNNEIKGQPASNEPLELVSARGEMRQLVIVLRARSTGAVEVAVNATGEVHYGYPGPALWQGGGSSPLTIVVEK